MLAVNKRTLFARLKAGKSCTLRTSVRAVRWLSDHWPEGVEWSAEVPRPARAEEQVARRRVAQLRHAGLREELIVETVKRKFCVRLPPARRRDLLLRAQQRTT